MKRVFVLGLLAGSLSLAHAQQPPAMADIPVPQLRAPSAGMLTGGQPEPAAWAALARGGITTVVNLRAGRRFGRVELALDVLNALDSNDHDIDYFYASRLPGEPTDGAEDLHYHVMEPRTWRLTASWFF